MCVAAGAWISSGESGIQPRPSASDYPAHQNVANLTVAAALLSPEQTRQRFDEDLNAMGYMVVEVAVYPDPDHKVDVAAHDFVLRLNPGGATAQPVTPNGLPAPLQTSLEHQALPEGSAAEPVAGYLYFPKLPMHRQKKGPAGTVDLTWNAPGGPVRVTLLSSR
jgi:hypothetical protein